jgi:ABC-type sugar transport system permease subunit
MAEFQWTATENLLTAVLIAYIWGSIGYFFLFVYSGVERIPIDLYEVARIDGANTIQVFFRITLPLLRDVIRVATVMWSITAINMFAFPRTFAPVNTPVTIITPPIYLYRLAFGTSSEATGEFALGKAAAGSVLLLILVVLVAVLLNLVLKEKREIEY